MPAVITSRRVSGTRVLTLDGECSTQTANDLSDRLAAAASETMRILVDVRGVTDLDSASGLLLQMTAGAIAERGGRLVAAANRSTRTWELITDIPPHVDLEVFDCVEAAASRLADPVEPALRTANPPNVIHLDQSTRAGNDTLEPSVVSATLDVLSYREGKIIEWRYGLYGSARVGYREIAERLSMNVAAVRNVEKGALARVTRGPA